TVTGSHVEPKRPLCQFSLRPWSLRSSANCHPCESCTGGGGPAATAAAGHASATTAASTRSRTRGTWGHMIAQPRDETSGWLRELFEALGEAVHPALACGGRGGGSVGRRVRRSPQLRVAQRRDVLERQQRV